MHEIRLRAPSFLGGGDSPVVIRRTDQRFIKGLFRDLKSEEGREHIATQVLPQQDEDEPVLGATHPLLAMDNCLCVPHLGYVERDGLEHMFDTIFDQILAYAAGKPINVLNPEVLAAKP